MKKILVAEDEIPLSQSLKLKLENEGFGVDVAENGEQAIQMLTQNKYDFILLDLIMPKKDGFQVLQEKEKMGVATPVAVTTNLSQNEDKEKTEKYGIANYFVKSNSSITEIINYVKAKLPRNASQDEKGTS
ncbi:MAG: response regulator transcription factor [Candidatus Dojkabacteria bacterium]